MENTMITRLLNLARPSVIAEGKAADQLGHAVSKIGGNPDLPAGNLSVYHILSSKAIHALYTNPVDFLLNFFRLFPRSPRRFS